MQSSGITHTEFLMIQLETILKILDYYQSEGVGLFLKCCHSLIHSSEFCWGTNTTALWKWCPEFWVSEVSPILKSYYELIQLCQFNILRIGLLKNKQTQYATYHHYFRRERTF